MPDNTPDTSRRNRPGPGPGGPGRDPSRSNNDRGPSGPGGTGGGGPGGSGPGGQPGGGGPGGAPRPSRGLLMFVLLLTGAFILFLVVSGSGSDSRKLTYAEFRERYEQNQIDPATVELREEAVFAQQRGGSVRGEQSAVYVPIGPGNADREAAIAFLNDLTKQKYTTIRPSASQQLLAFFATVLLPVLLVFLLIYIFLIRGLRSAAGGAGGMLGSFGKSRHKVLVKEKTGVTFADVAGIEEAKDEVEEIIEFLRNPKRFMRLGGRIPRGVLLIGEPGCGKTLLAKAIAGEADVPFFSISGSDFVEMFVGVGASRVRDLFKQAKESSPCIIFLDEIDAVGRRRGGGFTTGGHDEREQTLNAILVEMDGFTPSDGVIVIAATNRNDVLDPALIRPGRFDRQITVPLPDVKGRLEILKVHAKKVTLGPDANLERLAKATPTFSGADLAAIINEAAIAATLHNKDFIEQEDLEEARDKVKFGRARKSRVREAEDNRLTAYHEAGHAVLQCLLKDADPLHKVTIIPRGVAGGATFSLPEKDRMGFSARWLRATMRMACGGRIAEEMAVGDVSSGASMDIAQVTRIARMMVEEWGMSEKLGFIRYAAADTREMFVPDKAYSDETARLIDEEVRRIVAEAYEDARKLLAEHWSKVVAVAEALLRHETLDAPDVHKLMRGEQLSRPTVSDLLAAEARRARENAPPTASTPATQPPATEGPGSALPTPA